LVESTNAAIYEIDFIKQRFTYVNEKTCEYSGYTKAELMEMNPFQLLTADGKALFAERIEKLMKGEFISNTEEYQVIKKDGTKRWTLITADYVVKKEQIVGARVVALDITERKRRLSLIENVFDNSPVALGILDYDEGRRTFTHVNRFMCSMLGYSRHELIGKSALMVYPSKEEFDRVGKFKFELIEKGLSATIESQWKKKDGTIIDILLTTASLDKTDPFGSNTFTALDITKEKEEERYLNRRLESKLAQWKSETQTRYLQDNQIQILNQIIAGVKNDN
jgi:PAS domain S-box-containing protein